MDKAIHCLHIQYDLIAEAWTAAKSTVARALKFSCHNPHIAKVSQLNCNDEIISQVFPLGQWAPQTVRELRKSKSGLSYFRENQYGIPLQERELITRALRSVWRVWQVLLVSGPVFTHRCLCCLINHRSMMSIHFVCRYLEGEPAESRH